MDVLSVGCGGGTMDRRIADVFAQHTNSLHLVGVDPNPLHTEAFIECFADQPAEASAVTTLFEDYESDRRFDVIHFVHCLYYFEHIEPSLSRAISLLKPGGWLLVLQAPNESLNGLADRIWRKQWNRRAWFSNDVLATLHGMELDAGLERLDATVDVTSCLDDQNEHGRRLLDFIAQVETAALPSGLQSLLHEYLDVISQSPGCDGHRHAPHPVDVIAFRSPTQ